MNLKNVPIYKRPREKLIELGVKNLSDKELVAIILRTGTVKSGVMKTADSLLRKVHLKDLSTISVRDLEKISGVGNAHASSLVAAAELAHRIYSAGSISLTNPEQIIQILHHIAGKRQEYFVCLYVNARYNLITRKTISIGTIDASLAHPREVFRPAIECGASYIILAHNHPSGDPEPSEADILLTARMMEAGEVIGISVLDHVILAKNDWASLKKNGIM